MTPRSQELDRVNVPKKVPQNNNSVQSTQLDTLRDFDRLSETPEPSWITIGV